MHNNLVTNQLLCVYAQVLTQASNQFRCIIAYISKYLSRHFI